MCQDEPRHWCSTAERVLLLKTANAGPNGARQCILSDSIPLGAGDTRPNGIEPITMDELFTHAGSVMPEPRGLAPLLNPPVASRCLPVCCRGSLYARRHPSPSSFLQLSPCVSLDDRLCRHPPHSQRRRHPPEGWPGVSPLNDLSHAQLWWGDVARPRHDTFTTRALDQRPQSLPPKARARQLPVKLRRQMRRAQNRP